MGKLVQHFDIYGGMDRATKPHLLPQNKWRTLNSVRANDGLSQFRRKKVTTQISAAAQSPETILHISGLPQMSKRSLVVALTDKQVYQLRDLGTTPGGKILKRNGNQFRFNTDEIYRRWDAFVYQNNLFFANDLNAIRYTDGTQVYSLGTEVPRARYIEVFYDHILAGYVNWKGGTYPTRLMMSDLRNFGEFNPKPINESDYIEIDEYSLSDTPIRGITGIRKQQNYAVIYTPTSILRLDYVGLPKVLQWSPLYTEVGNGLPHSLVSFRDEHFFFNILDFNFYRLSGGSLEVIGDAIRSYVIDNYDIADLDAVQKFWGYVDRINNEVTWCFKSRASSGAIDKSVVYNWRTKEWYVRACEDLHSFFWGAVRSKGCDELAVGCNTIEESAYETGLGGTYTSCFGSSNGRIFIEDDGSFTLSDLYFTENPSLETGDFIYGDIGEFKEVDSIVIHADWDNGDGLKVEYSVRDNLDDEVVWRVAGMWTPRLPEKRLTMNARAAGRIWRWKFTMVGKVDITTTTNNVVAPGTLSLRAECLAPDSPYYIQFKKFNGPVYAIVPCPRRGGVYVCGRFTTYDGVATPGICRIKWDGTKDTTFDPGTGFDIAEPYYAPTQLQCFRNGDILVGLSYPNLKEREFHPTTNNYGALRFNGVTRGVVFKITHAGAYDATFDTSFLPAAKFNAFHMYEAQDEYFYLYNRDMTALHAGGPPLGWGTLMVLEKRNAAGVFQNGITNVIGATEEASMIFEPSDRLLFVSGIDSTLDGSNIYLYDSTLEVIDDIGSPDLDAYHKMHIMAIRSTDFSLVPGFFTYTVDGTSTESQPESAHINYGAVRGSCVAGGPLPAGDTNEWHWKYERLYAHKGLYQVTAKYTDNALADLIGPTPETSGFSSSAAAGNYEPDDQVNPLWTYRGKIWDFYIHPQLNEHCGYWLTGRITSFKGETIHTKPYQLFKLKADGSGLIGGFEDLKFGKDAGIVADYVDPIKGNCASAVFCAHLSPDGKVLYVGGRFDLVDDLTDWHGAISLYQADARYER